MGNPERNHKYNPKSTCCQCGCCGNGWDDSPGDELGLQLVYFRDAIVARPHVCKTGNEVHVEVGVVILDALSRKQGLLCSSNTIDHRIESPLYLSELITQVCLNIMTSKLLHHAILKVATFNDLDW